jgi:hypothetical protein
MPFQRTTCHPLPFATQTMAHPPHPSKTSKRLPPHILELPPASLPTDYDFLDTVPNPVIGISVPQSSIAMCSQQIWQSSTNKFVVFPRLIVLLASLLKPLTCLLVIFYQLAWSSQRCMTCNDMAHLDIMSYYLGFISRYPSLCMY